MLSTDQPVWASSEGLLARLSHKYKRTICITTVSLSIIAILVFYSDPLATTAPTGNTIGHERYSFTGPTVPKFTNAFNGTWDWRRDGRNLLLGSEQCDQAFPGLFAEVDRAVGGRRDRKITFEELDGVKSQRGYVRGMIYDQQLYIISVNGNVYSRNLATLHALHRAILTSPEPLPNIEFTFMANDKIDPVTSWSFTRRAEDKDVWLMPDFGFWSWPEPKVGSYAEVQRKIQEMEETSDQEGQGPWTWEKKKEELVWRGAAMDHKIRKELVEHTRNKDWADVKFLDWSSKRSKSRDLLTMSEHCQYKFVAHTEGKSYSGRLKYLQNCRSVVVTHKLTWIQHHHPLLISKGPDQNFVEVENDYSDLEEKMGRLLGDDGEAKRIADNGVRTFRERYLTPAAEVCYWRKLVKGWAEVSFEPEFYELRDGVKSWRGVPAESYFLLGKTEWEPS